MASGQFVKWARVAKEQVAKPWQVARFLSLLAFYGFWEVAVCLHSDWVLREESWVGVLGSWWAQISLAFLGRMSYVLPLTGLWSLYGQLKGRARPTRFQYVGLLLLTLGGTALLEVLFDQGGGLLGRILNYMAFPFLRESSWFFLWLPCVVLGLCWSHEGCLAMIERAVHAVLKWVRDGIAKRQGSWLRALGLKAFRQPEEATGLRLNLRDRLLDVAKQPPSGESWNHGSPSVAPTTDEKKTSRKETAAGDRKFNQSPYSRPALSLLVDAKKDIKPKNFEAEGLTRLSRELEETLQEFGVAAQVVGVHPGPVITRFELELGAGTKVSRVSGLAKDLARSLLVSRVRVVEIIPGKSVIGLEIPNPVREMVRVREILESDGYQRVTEGLPLALGKDIAGSPLTVDLTRMPHLLVAGTTGSGKSVGVNVMLVSLLYKATPQEVRLILIDPKMLELSIYEGIPHLLTPVVTDMKEAHQALRWCVSEMERRYRLMAALGVRNLEGFNEKIRTALKEGHPLTDPFWRKDPSQESELRTAPLLERLPYIVVIIDEFADMIMVVGKKVEELIARLAQKARAAGIHLILATQRPSVDVITGLIKANIPTRIAFQVSSRIDSRTILDQQGAEQLLGHGDMLYLPPGSGIPQRIHGAFISDEEVHRVVEAWKGQCQPDYLDLGVQGESEAAGPEEPQGGEADPLYDQAVQMVLESRKASISYVQRRLKIGYNRAARLIEAMELAGILGAVSSGGMREILVRAEER